MLVTVGGESLFYPPLNVNIAKGCSLASLMILEKSIPPLKVHLPDFQTDENLFSSGSKRKEK